MADAPKKITLKSTDTSRFKLSPPLPPVAPASEQAAAVTTPDEGQGGSGATTMITDPMALRETNTAKMKRVQLNPPRLGEETMAAATQAAAPAKKDSTDTVTLKVVRDKKKDLVAGGLASQTVRLRPPPMPLDGGAKPAAVALTPPLPAAPATPVSSAQAPGVETPMVPGSRETVKLTLPPQLKADASAATQAVAPVEQKVSTSTATIKLKPLARPKAPEATVAAAPAKPAAAAPATPPKPPAAPAVSLKPAAPSVSLRPAAGQTVTLKAAAPPPAEAAPTAETQIAETEPQRQTLKIKLPGAAAEAQATVALKDTAAGEAQATVALPEGGAEAAAAGPGKRMLKLKGGGRKAAEAAEAAEQSAAQPQTMAMPEGMAEEEDQVGIMAVAASLITVLGLGALMYFVTAQAMTYVF